jgi:hypothetical protein
MSLPLLKTPEHELKLPSTGEIVKYRPFLVGEEKTLLLALEGGDEEEIASAVLQTVNNCTFNKLDMTSLPMFDIEYLFLKIRSKAAGSTVEINVLCPDDNETYVPVVIDIDTIEVFKPEGHTNKIELTDTVGMILGYPTLGSTYDITGLNVSSAWEIVKRCIKQIYDADTVYERKDLKDKDLEDFLNQLDTNMFAKVEQFFLTVPRLKKEITVTNPKTGITSDVVIEGLQSFFV